MPISRKPSCPSGYILRDSYKTISGKCTPSRCIRKTGLLPGKSSEKTEKSIEKAKMRSNVALRMSKKRGLSINTKCNNNQTLRHGYRRMSYNRRTGKHYRHALVAPGCIKKRGKSKINIDDSINSNDDTPVDTPVDTRVNTRDTEEKKPSARIILDEDDHFLSEYGYHEVQSKSKDERYSALHNLINHFIPIKGEMATYNYVIKALNARYILSRNTNPKVAKIFKSDQRFISSEYKKIKHM